MKPSTETKTLQQIKSLLEQLKASDAKTIINQIHWIGVEILKNLALETPQGLKPNELLNHVMQHLGLEQNIEKLFEILFSTYEVSTDSKASSEADTAQQKIDLAEQLVAWFESMLDDPKINEADINERRKILRAQSNRTTLNESLTRIVIDYQLNQAGWQANTKLLTYQNGVRPQKNKNMAIAEWPTLEDGKQGFADYVLFKGLTPIAAVEAKRENEDVPGKIEQAERYSRGFQVEPPMVGAWTLEKKAQAWPVNETSASYSLPFVYSCNGRPYHSQLIEKSGTWFRDLRHSSNLRRALMAFHTPDGLEDLLTRNLPQARHNLMQEPFDYLQLRDYQIKGIQNIEQALDEGHTHALLAMATGTGKTRTALGIIYRLLKAERFKRILFLVDRRALGDQAYASFSDTPLEAQKKLTQIYTTANIKEVEVNPDARLQINTVQALNQRIFASDNPYPIDQFDCIIVDEAHRGYTLDQEMTEGELVVQDEQAYISSYRRVLDYFDAVKIGLTATPALHTVKIFGHPVFTYSYREAVAEGYLVDHEPPIIFETELSKNGIAFNRGEQVEVINRQTGDIEQVELEDELHFDIASFNRRVITKDFDRVICEALAKELDPLSQEKTLIFCVTDEHADRVKIELDKAFKAEYGLEYNQEAVKKITGKSDKPSELIKAYKNARYPNVAITVDLLATGIDVPKICNLVFMRRVKSRILYEQMLGRATRTCAEIHKSVFKIYDPVDLYASLESVNTMKPIVKDPNISLPELISQLTQPAKLEAALKTQGDTPEQNYAQSLLDQVTQKIKRVINLAESKKEQHVKIKEKLQALEYQWSTPPKDLPQHLRTIGVEQAVSFLQTHTSLCDHLNDLTQIIGSESNPVVSNHQDSLAERKQTYGHYEKPEDYLQSFRNFVQNNLNSNIALQVIATRPRDLTAKQLKDIRILLDNSGYTEANLDAALRQQTNQEIAATIVGYIRQAALGEPLISFEQRVEQTMAQIYQSQPWTPAQKKWLKRIQQHLIDEMVLDNTALDMMMDRHGGFKTISKRNFNDQLDLIIDQIRDNLWLVSNSRKQK